MAGRTCRWSMLVLGAVLLAACAPRPPRPVESMRAPEPVVFPETDYRQLAADGRVFWLDPGVSTLRIQVRRAGPLASQGHNHVIVAGDLQGAVFLPESGLADARFDVTMPVDALVVDPPAVREALGEDFASKLSQKNRDDTRRNMLGAQVLDAPRFPRVGVSSIAVAGRLPSAVATIRIALNGVRREQTVPLQVVVAGARLVAIGSLEIDQSEFGIHPFSVAGGLLRVADRVRVEFELVAEERAADERRGGWPAGLVGGS